VQQSVPVSGRSLPVELDDADDPSEPRRKRFASPRSPWWRPASTWGRAFLAFGLLVAVCTFAYAFHVCKSFLDHDPHFRISGTSNIQVVGLAELARAQLLPVFGEDIGRNIFFVPLAERRKQLEQIPWVQQATVMRLLPDQIRVAVVERQPVAFVRHGQQIGLVDANGVLLNMLPGAMSQHHYSFPVLTGIDGADPLPSRRARVELYLRLMSELDANGQRLSDQISEIDLTDPEDARVLMPEQGTDVLAHFGQDHFLDRYQRYKTHIAEWRAQYPKLAAVDLRYEQQVVLEMTPGAGNQTQSASIADNGKTAATGLAAHSDKAKPDPARRIASAELPIPSQAAKKPAINHAVAVKHANSKLPAKGSAKSVAAKAKDKKHAPTKPVAQKQTKKSPTKNRLPAALPQGQ
jgi:cell division protein FtsQ